MSQIGIDNAVTLWDSVIAVEIVLSLDKIEESSNNVEAPIRIVCRSERAISRVLQTYTKLF